ERPRTPVAVAAATLLEWLRRQRRAARAEPRPDFVAPRGTSTRARTPAMLYRAFGGPGGVGRQSGCSRGRSACSHGDPSRSSGRLARTRGGAWPAKAGVWAGPGGGAKGAASPRPFAFPLGAALLGFARARVRPSEKQLHGGGGLRCLRLPGGYAQR